MAQHYTSISINKNLYQQAKQFALSQRPPWNFSALVEIALEDFLIAQGQPSNQKGEAVKSSSTIELIPAA